MANNSKQLMAPVKYNGEMMSALQAWQCIDALPDGFPLSTDEAALFLRCSISKMERMRRDGSGPVYIQAGGANAKGTNQTVTYLKKSLQDWLKGNTVSSSMEAAIRKGQAFATIFDLAEAMPFYVDAIGAVESPAEENTIDVVIERLGSWDLVWLTPVEAAARRWTSLAAHRNFAGNVQRVLSNMQDGISSSLEASELAEPIPTPPISPGSTRL